MESRCDKLLECEYLQGLFDKIRIINPLKNEVVSSICEKSSRCEEKCYSIWKRDNACKNCISIRAYNENKTFIKLESSGNRIYSITAKPINKNGEKLVIEYIKDITDSVLISESDIKPTYDIYNKIERLNKLVITDELTKCYNRRYINEKLPIEISEAKENNKKLSIAVMDIDNFKNINDKYSHQVGDYILEEVVKIIKDNIIIEYDWVARYGGEEFLIVFKNIDSENIVQYLEKIRKSIEAHQFIYSDLNINVTASFGLVELSDNINEMDELVAIADENLYKAKKMGKNMIIK